MIVSSTAIRHAEADQACATAIDLARAAAEEDAGPDQVGAHVDLEAELTESSRICSIHSIRPMSAGAGRDGQPGCRSKVVTVSELLPGPDSLLAPPWVPWTERVRPGDLKAGDLMPASSDDERLVPFVAIVGEAGLFDWGDADAWRFSPELPAVRAVADEDDAEAREDEGAESGPRPPAEAGLRPRRALSAIGRDDAATRWYLGEHGPTSALASYAPGTCLTCGFMVRLGGTLGRVFGVCANEFAPDDGKVVSAMTVPAGTPRAMAPVTALPRYPRSTNSATTC